MGSWFSGICVIFDNDGIAVETESGHYQARREALGTLGIELTKDQYVKLGISRGHREFLGNVIPKNILSPKDYDQFFQEEIQRRYHEWREKHLQAVMGFERLVRQLDELEVQMAIASTQPKETVVSGLRCCLPEIYHFFRIIVSGEEVAHNKPAPDVYLRAATLMGFDPKNCVAVEDSVSGVKSAKSAAMICIARRNEWARDCDLLSAGTNGLCHSDYHDWMNITKIILRARTLGRF